MPALRRALFPFIAAYAVVLGLISQWVHPAGVLRLFQEDGPVEVLSVFFWIAAAVAAALFSKRFRISERIALVLASLTLAVREAGLPPDLVPSGKQLITLHHYADSSVPYLVRLMEAGVILVVAVSVIGAGLAVLRMLWQNRNWARAEGQLMLWAGFLLAVAQVFDALHPASEALTLLYLAFEEGFEMIAPALVCVSLCLYSRAYFRLPSFGTRMLRHH